MDGKKKHQGRPASNKFLAQLPGEEACVVASTSQKRKSTHGFKGVVSSAPRTKK